MEHIRAGEYAGRDDMHGGAERAVQALVLTGSLARQDGLVDALSDIDIELIAGDP